MNLECFTARELADVINDLGYKAKIVIENGKTCIESASSGVSWSVWLGLDDPFFDVMQLCTTIWVSENPFQWASNWNRRHCWSMAHVYVPEEHTQLLPDHDGEFAIYVGFAYDFSSGVSDKYLEIGFTRWIETINELVHTDSVRTLAVR